MNIEIIIEILSRSGPARRVDKTSELSIRRYPSEFRTAPTATQNGKGARTVNNITDGMDIIFKLI